jgi:hypothetical protein
MANRKTPLHVVNTLKSMKSPKFEFRHFGKFGEFHDSGNGNKLVRYTAPVHLQKPPHNDRLPADPSRSLQTVG